MKRAANVGTTAAVERVVLEVNGMQPLEFKKYEAEIMRQLNETFAGVAWNEIVPAQMQSHLNALVDEIVRANIQTLDMLSSLTVSTMVPDILAPNTGATTMTEHDHLRSHHHHHDAADLSKGAQDTNGPGKSAVDTPQTGGNSTSADSTNAASDQVGSQEPAPEPTTDDVKVDVREPVPVGQDAQKAPSDDSDAFG